MTFIKKYWKSILLVFIILGLSIFRGDKIKMDPGYIIPHFDKIAHFGMYFTLTFVVAFDYFKNVREVQKTVASLLIISFFASTYGGLMELAQHFLFVWRSGDFYDMLANISGAILAVPFFLFSRTKCSFIP